MLKQLKTQREQSERDMRSRDKRRPSNQVMALSNLTTNLKPYTANAQSVTQLLQLS